MKRLIATVSFAVLATPVFAQSSFGRTDAIGPDEVFNFNASTATSIANTTQAGQERTQVASSGVTRSDVAPAIDSGAEEPSRHVERQPGYFDPGQ